ncbi:transposase [bacterium]|nr:transposase [bacterium]
MTGITHDIYFVTKVVNRRVMLFTPDNAAIHIVIQNVNYYRRKFNFAIYGYVIMPDHYHIIIDTFCNVPIKKIKEDMNKNIARQIVKQFSEKQRSLLNIFSIRPRYRHGLSPHRYRIFQRGSIDLKIYSRQKLLDKLKYMHRNPIRGGLETSYGDYRFSSLRYYVYGEDALIMLDPLPF